MTDAEPQLGRGASAARLAAREAVSQVRLFFRNPVQALFLVVLPLTLVPLLHALNPHSLVALPGSPPLPKGTGLSTSGRFSGGELRPYDQYLVPVMAAFGITSACFATLAIRLTVVREQGALKRLRGTPLPPLAHLAGRVAAAAAIGLVVGGATIALGAAFYHVEVVPRLLPAAFVTALAGAACMCALGVAITCVLPSAEAAPAIVLAVLFPVAFVSNVFFAPELAPHWMHTIGAWLPLAPFARATAASFNRDVAAPGLQLRDLAHLGVWGAAATVVAVTRFQWTPHHEGRAQTPRAPRLRHATAIVVALLVAAAAIWAGTRTHSVSTKLDLGPLTALPNSQPQVLDVPVPDDLVGRSVAGGALDAVLDHSLGDTTVHLVVTREASTVAALIGRSPLGGCDVALAGGVDAGWLAGLPKAHGAVDLVDACSGERFDLRGRCTGGVCDAGLPAVEAKVSGGRVALDLEHITAPPTGTGNSTAPGPIAGSYALTGTLDGAAISSAAVVTWSDSLTVYLDRGTPLVTIATNSTYAGTFSGLDVDGVTEDSLAPPTPLRWLSLPVGASDPDGASPTDTVVVTHPAAGEWVVAGGDATFTLRVSEDAAPWARFSIALRSSHHHAQLQFVAR